MRVTWAARSHPGMRRPVNEDSFCAREDLGLFLVADGMGGHVAGEVASRLAAEAIEAFVAETATGITEHTWPGAYDPHLSEPANRLLGAFRLANRRLTEEMSSTPTLRGMATTASALLIAAGAAPVIAHVGDSRVYLRRGGELRRVTTDHSWVEEQVRAGLIDASAASSHPWRNVVTRALSGGTEPEVDVCEVKLEPNDRLLLCSDGLFGVVSDDRISEAIGTTTPLQAACDRLVTLANEEGGPDNVTVLALEIHAP